METKSGLSDDTKFLIDFNVHCVPAALGLEPPFAAGASMFGIAEEEFAAYAREVEEDVERTARQLLAMPAIAEAIGRIALPRGGTFMTMGDSITTYRRGYAELLRTMFRLRRSEEKINLANVGRSGFTSTQGLEGSYTGFLAKRPSVVTIMFGTNDCKRFGKADAPPLVTEDDYRKNITEIVAAYRSLSSARLALITAPPVLERIANTFEPFAPMKMTWDNNDLRKYGAIVMKIATTNRLPVVDLMKAFGNEPDPQLYLADGIHPSPSGQQLILERLLQVL